MILVLSGAGPVAEAVGDARRAAGETEKAVAPDLFAAAVGCRAVVYVPVSPLLEAAEPEDAEARMREVLRGAHAPGCKQLVVVLPGDAPFTAACDLVRKDGTPYTFVRSAPLLEELADRTKCEASRSVWLTRGRKVELATRDALAATIRQALEDPFACGGTLTAPSATLDAAEALVRATAISGAALKVHVAPPSMSFAMRKLHAWMGRAAPEVESLCDRIASGR